MATARTNVATKAKPKSSSTAVATLDYTDELASIAKRLQSASTADRIKTSNAKVFILPDKSEHDELDVIVVDFIAFNRYYPGMYDEDNIVPPDCFAIGLEPTSMVPSDNSPDKQCASCAGCWANQFKSAANKKGKACGNTRLLAVLLPPTGGLGVNDDLDSMPLYTISVSPTAITSFDEHVGKVVRSFSKPVRGVITRMSFAQDSKWPSLRFNVVAPAGKELEMYAQSRLAEVRERLAVEPDVSAIQAANDEKAAAKAPAKRASRR